MTDFEDRLRQALRAEDPSPDFVAKVLQRVARPARRSLPARWLMAAAIVLAAAGVAQVSHQQRERRLRSERAQAELRLALEITSEKLNVVFRKLQSNQEN